MAWPGLSDYQQYITKFLAETADPELASARVVARAGSEPLAFRGDKSCVFKASSGAGTKALKLFTSPPDQLEQRYAWIGRQLSQLRLPYFVRCSIVEGGIDIGGRTLPVVKLDWVSGTMLFDYLCENLGAPLKLKQLAGKWLEMSRSLRSVGIAHGDLEPGNVFVVDDSLVLIDYDNMFVPGMHNLVSPDTGAIHFQHPRRVREDFGPYLDNFSDWVMYTTLMALSKDPALWSRVNPRARHVLFSSDDFRSPGDSEIFKILKNKSDKLRMLAISLENLLSYAIKDIPPLDPARTVPQPARSGPSLLVDQAAAIPVAGSPTADVSRSPSPLSAMLPDSSQDQSTNPDSALSAPHQLTREHEAEAEIAPESPAHSPPNRDTRRDAAAAPGDAGNTAPRDARRDTRRDTAATARDSGNTLLGDVRRDSTRDAAAAARIAGETAPGDTKPGTRRDGARATGAARGAKAGRKWSLIVVAGIIGIIGATCAIAVLCSGQVRELFGIERRKQPPESRSDITNESKPATPESAKSHGSVLDTDTGSGTAIDTQIVNPEEDGQHPATNVKIKADDEADIPSQGTAVRESRPNPSSPIRSTHQRPQLVPQTPSADYSRPSRAGSVPFEQPADNSMPAGRHRDWQPPAPTTPYQAPAASGISLTSHPLYPRIAAAENRINDMASTGVDTTTLTKSLGEIKSLAATAAPHTEVKLRDLEYRLGVSTNR